MKYIDSEILISAMILGMYENNVGFISEDDAEKFDMDYTMVLKEKYFPNEPLISDHISRETLIKFAETYPEYVEFSRLKSTFYIKWKPENQELAFRTLLLNNLTDWSNSVDIRWTRGETIVSPFSCQKWMRWKQ